MNAFDVVHAVWAKAEVMHGEQMAKLAKVYAWADPPLSWEEIGLEARMAWYEAAERELRVCAL